MTVKTRRPVSPFADTEDWISCPECQEEVPISDLILEGGGICPGCRRAITLYVETGEFVPENPWGHSPENFQQ